ncbi:ATP-binding cassette domain-containing protein [Sunxiuqinia sp. A32]|uniref:ATP-binding cassette domain-containing protein n=1 Tax=Sunxiuqinia sp. A32 TaxID=3461496 RepID=UPI004045927F
MYEGIIENLLKLFAIVTDYDDKQASEHASNLVNSYLQENFNRELVEKYQTLYHDFVQYYHTQNKEILYEEEGSGKKFINKSYIKKICKGIVDQFDLGTRFMIVVQLLNFINKEDGVDENNLLTVDIVAKGLKIKSKEYKDLARFFLKTLQDVKEKANLFVVNGNEEYSDNRIKHLYRENQQVELELIRVSSINTIFFKYWGPRNMYLNGHRLTQKRLYVFPPGGILRTSRIIPIYYSSIMTRFIQEQGKPKIVFNAENVEYRFSRRNFGLHPLSFQERSGDLVGILGGSGVGKTTLLNVLNGKLKPHKGKIIINGYDLHDPENKEILKGTIGYVPQDDLLLEELTVYENLKYNARFCFGNMSEEEIQKKIDQTLHDFDLIEARDLVVGSPLKKILSGGQRKRLNIALELMREPSILFVDEPTSGLSSADSEKVLYLLKRQCLKGKLVFANIHQPSSDIYKLFDRMIVMDKGGRVVFFGNPMEAITYFKNEANYINPNESECLTCGNVKTEQPLRIIETRMVDPFGKSIRKRKISPEEWYQKYKEKVEPRVVDFMELNPNIRQKFPEVYFETPKWFKQLKLFIKRDFATKKANRQYLAIALLEAPILAVLLGFFSKYSDSSTYLFRYNDNIPAFLFMSVVVALFIGLSISAEEIFKDRKIRTREEFLNLSRGAYLSSKILILFALSAIQVLSFVLIGNYMLEIRDVTFSTWAILFTTACFANLLGLNLSAGFNSVVAIYILIPLLLVPQLLLSGVIIDFNKMHNSLSSYNKTPLIGDAMTSRWAYEALAVNLYKNNEYESNIFDEEVVKNDLGFKAFYMLPEIEKYLISYNAFELNKQTEEAASVVPLLKNSFEDLFTEIKPNNDSISLAINQIGTDSFENKSALLLKSYLKQATQTYKQDYFEATKTLENKYQNLLSKFDGNTDALTNFKNHYTNNKLEVLVRDKYSTHKTYIANNRIHQGDEPIYRKPAQTNGSAHFYSAYKYLGDLRIDSTLFNIIFTWIFTFLLMVALYFDVLRKVITYVERWRLNRQAQLRDRIFYNPMSFMKPDQHKNNK